MAPGSELVEDCEAVAARFTASDLHPYRQILERPEAGDEFRHEVLVARAVLLDEYQMHPPGAEAHAVDRVMTEQAVQDEHR